MAGLQRARDQLLHDFVGAGVDALHAAIGPHARDRVFGHVAVASVQLHAFIDDGALAVCEPVLRHGCGGGVKLALHQAFHTVVKEDAADVRFGFALGEFEAGVLKLEQRFAERAAIFAVLDGDGDSTFEVLRGTDGEMEDGHDPDDIATMDAFSALATPGLAASLEHDHDDDDDERDRRND